MRISKAVQGRICEGEFSLGRICKSWGGFGKESFGEDLEGLRENQQKKI